MGRKKRRAFDRFDAVLLGIVAAALLWRVGYVLAQQDDPFTGDGGGYYTQAVLLGEGHGFINTDAYGFTVATHVVRPMAIPTADHPPAWPVVMASLSLVGIRDMLAHQLFAAGVGALTVGMVGLTARRIFGVRAGLIAAAIAAVYPNFWLYERLMLSETLTFLVVAVLCFVTYGFLAEPTRRGAVALGVACAVVVLTRAEAVLLLVGLLAPLLWARRELDRSTRLRWLGLAAGAAVLTIMPWSLYNSARFDRPVVVTTSLGATVSSANCDAVYDGPNIGWWSVWCLWHSKGSVDGHADAAAQDAEMTGIGLRYANNHLHRLPAVVAAREGRAWSLYQPFRQAELDEVSGPTRTVSILGVWAFWLVAIAAVGGAVVAHRRGIPLYPFAALSLTVVLSVAITIGQPRYRALAEVPIVLLAAVGIDQLSRAMATGASRTWRSTRPPPTRSA